MQDEELNEISGSIISAAMRVHTALGPGLLESAYQACLKHELEEQGFRVESELALPIRYEKITLDAGYRIDLLVDNLVIVELKAVTAITPVHEAQLLSYLKLGGKPLGLIINFHVKRLKDGIKRMRI
jgi:GxxExxY protein